MFHLRSESLISSSWIQSFKFDLPASQKPHCIKINHTELENKEQILTFEKLIKTFAF